MTKSKPMKLPFKLKRALEANDEDRVTACIEKLLNKGWDYPDLIRSFENHRMNMLIENIKQQTENKKNGDNILLTKEQV